MDASTARQILELTLHEYSKARREYWGAIYDDSLTYLSQLNRDENWFRDAVRTAIKTAFAAALAMAWVDSGSDQKISVNAVSFIASQELAEYGFVEGLLYSLRLVKHSSPEDLLGTDTYTQEDLDQYWDQLSTEHADGYARTMDRMYNNVKVMGAGDKILTFGGLSGEESCHHCITYYGLSKPAKWWITNDAVPPNRRFDCKGYKCFHVLIDQNGFLFTI